MRGRELGSWGVGVASGGAGVGWVAPGWVWLPFASVGSYVRVAVCATQWWVSICHGRSAETPPLPLATSLASERARRRATRGRRFALPKNAKHGRPARCLHPCRSKEGTVATTQRSADLCVRRPCDRWLLRRGTPFVCDAPSCGHGSARRTLNQCVARNARASLEWR